MRIRLQIERGATTSTNAPSARSRVRRLLASLIVLGLVGALAGYGTYSAFTATNANTGNSFASGSVAIEDNDNDVAMLALANAKPGDSDTSCIKVRYTGSLASTVRIYGTVAGTLSQYLTLTVTRGTDSSPSYDGCANFSTAGEGDYIGQGAGVIWQGNLSTFPATYAAGIVDPLAGSPESWTTGEEHSYRFVVTLQDTDAAQNLSGTAAFTWEARNQ
jgi:type II secretory pathway pseudopilin PulG